MLLGYGSLARGLKNTNYLKANESWTWQRTTQFQRSQWKQEGRVGKTGLIFYNSRCLGIQKKKMQRIWFFVLSILLFPLGLGSDLIPIARLHLPCCLNVIVLTKQQNKQLLCRHDWDWRIMGGCVFGVVCEGFSF